MVDGEKHWCCVRCNEVKEAAAFGKNKANMNGLNSYCKPCISERQAILVATPDGLRRQRARQRRWIDAHPEQHAAACKRRTAANRDRNATRAIELREAHPERAKAINAIHYALKRGEIAKPVHCEMCDADRPLEGHHPSYDKDRWLTVTWLCRRCHKFTHARLDDQSKGVWI
jgi:hypothetical protein